MKSRVAVLPGSFDPITNGHLWMVARAASAFDWLIVAIGHNPEKKCMFALSERIDMITEAVAVFPNVGVEVYQDIFLVDFARAHGASVIIRGIRKASDFDYERDIKDENEDLAPDIATFHLI